MRPKLAEIPKLVAKTANQKTYIKCIKENQVIFCNGPAGTGKTTIAIAMAVEALRKDEVDKIIFARPLIECGIKTGHLPGTLREKLEPYLVMMERELQKWTTPGELRKWESENKIERCAIEYLRGRNFEKDFVIIDEIENASYTQIKMLITRICEESKICLIGDGDQTDIQLKIKNTANDYVHIPDFLAVMDQLSNVQGVGVMELDENDIVRSDIVGRIIKALRNF